MRIIGFTYMKCNSGIFTYSLLPIPVAPTVFDPCLTSVWPLYDLCRSAVDQRWLHDEVPVAWSILSQREEDQIQRQMEGALPSVQTEWKTREREILPLRFPQSWYCIVKFDCVCNLSQSLFLLFILIFSIFYLSLFPFLSLSFSCYFFASNLPFPSLSPFLLFLSFFLSLLLFVPLSLSLSLSVSLPLCFFLCLPLFVSHCHCVFFFFLAQ